MNPISNRWQIPPNSRRPSAWSHGSMNTPNSQNNLPHFQNSSPALLTSQLQIHSPCSTTNKSTNTSNPNPNLPPSPQGPPRTEDLDGRIDFSTFQKPAQNPTSQQRGLPTSPVTKSSPFNPILPTMPGNFHFSFSPVGPTQSSPQNPSASKLSAPDPSITALHPNNASSQERGGTSSLDLGSGYNNVQMGGLSSVRRGIWGIDMRQGDEVPLGRMRVVEVEEGEEEGGVVGEQRKEGRGERIWGKVRLWWRGLGGRGQGRRRLRKGERVGDGGFGGMGAGVEPLLGAGFA